MNKFRSTSLHVRRKLPSSIVVRYVEMRSMSSGGSRSRSGAVAMVDDVGVGTVQLNGREVLIYQSIIHDFHRVTRSARATACLVASLTRLNVTLVAPAGRSLEA